MWIGTSILTCLDPFQSYVALLEAHRKKCAWLCGSASKWSLKHGASGDAADRSQGVHSVTRIHVTIMKHNTPNKYRLP